jgi:hypothetical protein
MVLKKNLLKADFFMMIISATIASTNWLIKILKNVLIHFIQCSIFGFLKGFNKTATG